MTAFDDADGAVYTYDSATRDHALFVLLPGHVFKGPRRETCRRCLVLPGSGLLTNGIWIDRDASLLRDFSEASLLNRLAVRFS